MPIDKDVLERVSKSTVCERIAWALHVARQYDHIMREYLARLSWPNNYGTIEEIRADEKALVDRVRHAARHVNYALDQIDAERAAAVFELFPPSLTERIRSVMPRGEIVVPVSKPRARKL